MNSMDRTRVRGGLFCENYVFFDPAEFESLAGGRPRVAGPAGGSSRQPDKPRGAGPLPLQRKNDTKHAGGPSK